MSAKKYVYLSDDEKGNLYLEVHEEDAVMQNREGWLLSPRKHGQFAVDARMFRPATGSAPTGSHWGQIDAAVPTVARWSASAGVELGLARMGNAAQRYVMG